ncbi:mannitol dehydrogenase family protein [Acidisoma cellulosilytica]|uniref:Mannitol dehydrogenase family protein n=1 Tax=Acidisoma cellulosilyticum TaxID=2802395 RepID=A0A964E5F7_9PROT|nr:mannitol dehydrogenase family protein [Acidisoma cellulosilyticum]MCB8882377.1 mannitol dehydrogenase family protein [Acidisoma cellulosilyticum]
MRLHRTEQQKGWETGIVHLGLGAFARAHLALYTEDAQDHDWGIIGVSLQRPDQRDHLAPQDCLYTALERRPEGNRPRLVTCLTGVLVAPEDPDAVLAVMSLPATRIVTLTITEKGYCHDPATGKLNWSHPTIMHDLANPAAPKGAIGFIVEALRRRQAAGLPPFTVLCCDNLPANGHVVAGLVREFAERMSPDLASWIAAEGQFPCAMVDRIVPATTEADIAEVEKLTGFADAAPVVHEPFRQWVIEDRFVEDARPHWEIGGAQFVAHVEPFEHMKLRLLNGAHSALAYLGYLGGHETIADTMQDKAYAAFVERLWQTEIVPVVPAPPDTDLLAYVAALKARFSNPAIRHRTWQIAMDGSQKLPQRLLGTIRERLAQDLPLPCLALVIAGWIRYVGGIDEQGSLIDVRDPLADTLKTVQDAAPDAAAAVRAVIGLTEVFGQDLSQDSRFVDAVVAAYTVLQEKGARAAVVG